MKKGLTRRDFLKAGGGALAGAYVLGLSGCGGGGDATSGEAVRLRMTWWGSQDRHEAINEAIGLYQRKNPDVTVATVPSGYEGYFDKLTTQVSGGSGPDLFMVATNNLFEYAERGVLLDLTPFVGGQIDVSNIGEDVLAPDRVEGKTYAIPGAINSEVLVYSAGMLEEAGVEAPDNTWTWDDFAKLTTEVSKALGDGVYGTEDAGGLHQILEVFVRQKGEEVFAGGKLGFGEEELTEWFAYWDDLRKSGAATPGDITAQSVSSETNPLVRGSAAMALTWTEEANTFAALTGDELGLNVVPNGSEDARPGQFMFIKPANYWSMYSDTEYPEEAARIIDFLLNDPEAIRILGLSLGVPASTRAEEAIREDASAIQRQIFDYMELVRQNSTPLSESYPTGYLEVQQLLLRTNENIAFGRATIDEAVGSFFEETERILG